MAAISRRPWPLPSELARDGISCEVIDLRSLRPLDDKTILASVEKTHRAVIVDEGWRTGSLAAEISARIMEGAFYALDAPVARVCSAEVPIPYARHLETAALPQVPGIVARGARSAAPMTDFRMPSLGADMDEGTLVEWLKKPGDKLARGDIIAVVETQKGAIEIEVFHDGVLEQVHVKPGAKVPVGELLATIRTEHEPAVPDARRPRTAQPAQPAAAPPPYRQSALTARFKITPGGRALGLRAWTRPVFTGGGAGRGHRPARS